MKESVDYQAVLDDLKAKRARLDGLIAGIEAEIGGQSEGLSVVEPVPGGSTPGPMAMIHPDTFFGLSIIEAAKKYLKIVRRAQHTTAIADGLAKGGLKRPEDGTLSSILVRATKGREVVKVGKATWGLSEWYPKPPKESKEPTKGRRKRPGRPRKASQAKSPTAKKAKATTAPRAAPGETAHKNGARPSDVALEIMRAAGKPLHAVEITKRVNERGVAALRLPIESFLNRQTKAGKMQKVGPSMFVLAS